MKKSNAYKLGEKLFRVGVYEFERVSGVRGKPKTLATLMRKSINYPGAQYLAWLAIGEYVEKNFRRKKK